MSLILDFTITFNTVLSISEIVEVYVCWAFGIDLSFEVRIFEEKLYFLAIVVYFMS